MKAGRSHEGKPDGVPVEFKAESNHSRRRSSRRLEQSIDDKHSIAPLIPPPPIVGRQNGSFASMISVQSPNGQVKNKVYTLPRDSVEESNDE